MDMDVDIEFDIDMELDIDDPGEVGCGRDRNDSINCCICRFNTMWEGEVERGKDGLEWVLVGGSHVFDSLVLPEKPLLLPFP